MLNEQEYKDTIRLLIQQRDDAIAAARLTGEWLAYPYGREWSAEQEARRQMAENAVRKIEHIRVGSIPRQ